jgi:N terminus of Rad21 / Rec8 like protein
VQSLFIPNISRLVATLGSKSSLKTVTRKKILDVDVHKACDTIQNPEAPMALRLQGNLLYVHPFKKTQDSA